MCVCVHACVYLLRPITGTTTNRLLRGCFIWCCIFRSGTVSIAHGRETLIPHSLSPWFSLFCFLCSSPTLSVPIAAIPASFYPPVWGRSRLIKMPTNTRLPLIWFSLLSPFFMIPTPWWKKINPQPPALMTSAFDMQLFSCLDILGVATPEQSSLCLARNAVQDLISAWSWLLLLWFSNLIVTFWGHRPPPRSGHRWLGNSEADGIERLGMGGGVELRSGGERESKIGSGDHHKVWLS